MNVLFLDVDGVLNRCGRSMQGLESDKVELLRWIVKATGAVIVVSSTWREKPHQMQRLRLMFDQIGAKFGGVTPIANVKSAGGIYVGWTRGEEIQQWLDENGRPEKFVILDDDSNMGELRRYQVKTESYVGLTHQIAHDVIEAFKSQSHESQTNR